MKLKTVSLIVDCKIEIYILSCDIENLYILTMHGVTFVLCKIKFENIDKQPLRAAMFDIPLFFIPLMRYRKHASKFLR